MKKKQNTHILIWSFFDPWGKEVLGLIKREINNLIFFDNKNKDDFYFSHNNHKKIFNLIHLFSLKEISEIKKYEKYFNEFFNSYYSRFDLTTNYFNLKQLFKCYCLYIIDFYNKKNITHIVFNADFGIGFDLLSYRIAKEKKIKTLIFGNHPFDNNEFFFSENLDKWGFFKRVKFQKIISNYRSLEKIVKAKTAFHYHSKPASKRNFLYFFLPDLKLLYSRSIFNPKKFFNSILNISKNLKYYKFIKKNRSFPFVSKNPPNQYIFFPLHEQPEASTISFGNIIDQASVCETISKKLPKNMFMVIKENPTQENLNHRDKDFYERLKLCKNLIFTNINDDTNQLIKKCKILLTITGSAGFEALIANKPIIIFGNSWYQSLHGVYKFSPDLKIETIIKKKFSKKKFLKSITALQAKLLNGRISKYYTRFDKNILNKDSLAKKTAETIIKMIKNS